MLAFAVSSVSQGQTLQPGDGSSSANSSAGTTRIEQAAITPHSYLEIPPINANEGISAFIPLYLAQSLWLRLALLINVPVLNDRDIENKILQNAGREFIDLILSNRRPANVSLTLLYYMGLTEDSDGNLPKSERVFWRNLLDHMGTSADDIQIQHLDLPLQTIAGTVLTGTSTDTTLPQLRRAFFVSGQYGLMPTGQIINAGRVLQLRLFIDLLIRSNLTARLDFLTLLGFLSHNQTREFQVLSELKPTEIRVLKGLGLIDFNGGLNYDDQLFLQNTLIPNLALADTPTGQLPEVTLLIAALQQTSAFRLDFDRVAVPVSSPRIQCLRLFTVTP